jgi:hypothetical protein
VTRQQVSTYRHPLSIELTSSFNISENPKLPMLYLLCEHKGFPIIMGHINNKLRVFFLAQFETASFVIQQKTFVLMWIQIIVIPVMTGLIVVNIFRNDPKELASMIVIDVIVIALMAMGLFLMRRGAYEKVAQIEIYCAMILTVVGYFIKHHVVINTGFNPFSVMMFASIALTAMFGSRFAIVIVGLLYSFVNVVGYLIVKDTVSPSMHFYLVSATLMTGAALIIAWWTAYLIRLITDKALLITQNELQKNLLLNQTLEEQVETRTAELQASINQIKVLGGLLPICSSCKKIRDDQGYWQQLEQYLHQHSEAEFSHSICPECTIQLYPELFPDNIAKEDDKK